MRGQFKETKVVAAICRGTVIDHIPAGYGMKIAQFLQLAKYNMKVTLGLNLHSTRHGFKDIIKVEGRSLTPSEANHIAILAPDASINIIENYEVIKKFHLSIPETIEEILRCPNVKCISNHERISSKFHLTLQTKNQIRVECHYCKRSLTKEEIS